MEEENDVPPCPDWLLAKELIQLFINNNPPEAESLFELHHKDSLCMYAAYSYIKFMDALMSFEDDKLAVATNTLKDVEKKCQQQQPSTSWLKKVFSTASQETVQENGDENASCDLTKMWETQIIMADSHVCSAILVFLQQDVSGFFKCGWILRKAWKIYQQVYKEIAEHYREELNDNIALPILSDSGVTSNIGSCSSSLSSIDENNAVTAPATLPPNGYRSALANSQSLHQIPSTSTSFLKRSFSIHSNLKHSDWSFFNKLSPMPFITHFFPITPSTAPKLISINPATINRLMSSVSFGFGLFHLGMSLLPPSLLKLTNLFGFRCSRQNGLNCLNFTRRSNEDFRSPLAILALLWYHTIVRPFYALDGTNNGVEAATQLLNEERVEEQYGESALFRFFRGRICRLESQIGEALKNFQCAVDVANQRELKLLSLHEVGWCHLIQLDYVQADGVFQYLKLSSRWSKSFYCYLNIICNGAASAGELLDEASLTNLIETGGNNNKVNQLDGFLTKRLNKVRSDKDNLSNGYFELLIFEMLYLWNALNSCSRENMERIEQNCLKIDGVDGNEPIVGLSKLVLGSLHAIHFERGKEMGNLQMAIENFEQCLSKRKKIANDGFHHVSAMAQYELAALLVRNDERRNEGKQLLQQMNQYKDYDFEQRLNVRVHTLLKNLQ